MPNETPVQRKPILDKEFQVQGETQIFCPRCKRPIKGYLEVAVRLVSKGQVVPQPKVNPTFIVGLMNGIGGIKKAK